MRENRRPGLAIFAPSFGDGGVERMLVNLAAGVLGEGVAVDFLVGESDSPYLGHLPDRAQVVYLPRKQREGLIRYLRERRPQVLLSGKARADQLALEANRIAAVGTRVALRVGTTLSPKLQEQHLLQRWHFKHKIRSIYPRADVLIAVSQGVADDLSAVARIPPARIHVLPNPVITPELQQLAAQSVSHPWLLEREIPVIVAVGRLAKVKDFGTLMKAFAVVRRTRPCRLIILGDGGQRNSLETLASRLEIRSDVDLPGFDANPYKYLSRANLFVLSSIREGSPNALTEALAVCTPAVSTDCMSGPREILQGGRYGKLVPVGDEQSLATAIRETLDSPPDPASLQEAVREYTQENSARRYIQALGLQPAEHVVASAATLRKEPVANE